MNFKKFFLDLGCEFGLWCDIISQRRQEMSFIETIKQRAKQNIKTIVLPEAEDIRTLKATEIVLREKYAKIILIRKWGTNLIQSKNRRYQY